MCNKEINKLHCVVVLPLYVCMYLNTGIVPSLQWLKCHHIVLLLTKKVFLIFNQVSSKVNNMKLLKIDSLKNTFVKDGFSRFSPSCKWLPISNVAYRVGGNMSKIASDAALIGMREGTFHHSSFLNQTLSAEFLSKLSKLFWRWKLTSIGFIWHPAKPIESYKTYS